MGAVEERLFRVKALFVFSKFSTGETLNELYLRNEIVQKDAIDENSLCGTEDFKIVMSSGEACCNRNRARKFYDQTPPNGLRLV